MEALGWGDLAAAGEWGSQLGPGGPACWFLLLSGSLASSPGACESRASLDHSRALAVLPQRPSSAPSLPVPCSLEAMQAQEDARACPALGSAFPASCCLTEIEHGS